jgi:S-(hydroxymethyl)glutathione dehydrogenase/alcohol dehydrogenase
MASSAPLRHFVARCIGRISYDRIVRSPGCLIFNTGQNCGFGSWTKPGSIFEEEMKAAVLREFNRPMAIEDLVLDNPGPNEVLVRTVASGLCHSELHWFSGEIPAELPFVAGHEAAGIVVKVGHNVTRVKPGDAVVTCISLFCGECEFCLSGRMALCRLKKEGRTDSSEPRLRRPNGEIVHQMFNLGAFAEQMLIPQNACTPIDPEMPLDRAALIGCAVVTGAGAVFHSCDLRPGESVAVIGCGGIGLSAVNAAKIAGAGRIVAVDPRPEKREMALRMGATDAVDAFAEGAAEQIKDLTKGGPNYTIEAVGRAESAQLAVDSLGRGGTAVIVGVMPPEAKVSLGYADLMDGKRLQACLMGDNRFPIDVPRLVDFYMRGMLDLDTLVAERITLDQINEGYNKLKTGKSARSVIVFD